MTSTAEPASRLSGVVFRTPQFEKLREFYGTAPGLAVGSGPTVLNGRRAMLLDAGSAFVELREIDPGDLPARDDPSVPRLAIRTTLTPINLAAHGIALNDPPRRPATDDPGQDTIAHVRDPDGHLVQLRWQHQ